MNLSKKILIFYHFQNQLDAEVNMTTLKKTDNKDALVRDAIESIPLDVSLGLYHFRFKIQFVENQQRSVGWIDISNLLAKVPVINQCIYIKILTLSHNRYNKLFSIQRLSKAKNLVEDDTIAKSKTIVVEKKPPTLVQQAEFDLIKIQKAIKIETKTEAEKNLQTMRQSSREEEEDRSLEVVAKKQLEEKIMKWGYTDGKKINNTPTLLATLHEIWPQWPQISLTQMLQPQQVIAMFKKAVIKVHPDKNRNQNYAKKYLSKKSRNS